MKKTITVQIGNSDDKLSQARWSDFQLDVGVVIGRHAAQVHFGGTSPGSTPWQNAAWVMEVEEKKIAVLQRDLAVIGKAYEQDGIAFTEGETRFI